MGLWKICCSYRFEMRRTCVEFEDNGKEPIREESSEAIGGGGGWEGEGSRALDLGKVISGDRKGGGRGGC